jgi:predicted DNA-binding transcriptional regulator AlpA
MSAEAEIAPAEHGGDLVRGWAGATHETGMSRTQLWRGIRAGTFPAPIVLGPNSVAWFKREIDEWLASRPRRTYTAPAAAAEIAMPENSTPGRRGPDRAGLDDFRGRRQSEASLDQNTLRAQALRRMRRQRLVERVCALGHRAVFELVDELDRHLGLGDDLDRRLERYAALDPGLLVALGGDRFPAAPLRAVGAGR